MATFQLIALTPPGLTDPSIAIAASRGGGLGVLDLEHSQDERASLAALAKLAQYAKGSCGVKLDGRDEQFLSILVSDIPSNVEVVILTPAEPDILHRQVKTLHKHRMTALLETTCVEQALLGAKVGVDGLIAKGNEAGGWVGQETTFILLQRLLARVTLPVWVQGGIGLHTAAACYAAGVAGVVLDAQLALTRESSLPESAKAIISRMDGTETICLGEELDSLCRVYIRPGLPVVEDLCRLEEELVKDSRTKPEILETWRQEVRARVGWGSPDHHIWLLGQDAAFAASMAQRFGTVGGILEGMRQAIDGHVRTAQDIKPLGEDAPLARSHGTHYPIVQGPMARVSDVPSFAAKVAEAGALPFLALGWLNGSEAKALIRETREMLDEQPWGVGILGFVPQDLWQEQIDIMRTYRPPFALIAGGRPDQARVLEQEGIPTYLHVPSPALLRISLQNGIRRFVFEGRECGGHVGPRSSFVLWNAMIDVLVESLSGDEIADCHVLFAGGIHDAVSSSMVATIATPLAERGTRVGVLLGTAYLFTEEAVATGAIVNGYQQEAIQCLQTVLLETGQGHAIRCVDTPYTEEFKHEKYRLMREGRSPEEIRNVLEDLNRGRVRIASKAIKRRSQYGGERRAPQFVSLPEEEQHVQGLYMIGQVAALHDQTCTMEDLHREISTKGAQRLEEVKGPGLSHTSTRPRQAPCDVAIIGMACLMPKAPDLHTYWENILNKVDAITEVPRERWDWQLYFDSDPKSRDKVYSKWGGFLDPVAFDPVRYGIPPNSLPSIEPIQLLTLETVRAAIEDAGYANRAFPRERTSVIIGVGGGIADLTEHYAFRSNLPTFIKNVSPDILSQLPEWTEDSFPGTLLNVTAGRVANRFDLGGVNYTVDAACASSLASLYLAARELQNETSDMVIAGGADTFQNPFAYLCFSKTHALTPSGRSRPFDESADGTAIGEGIAILVLKRLADAERDGDRIYAVIKGIGGSSDGRDKGLTAPRPEGQARALERAYAMAGISPATVGLIEAHGTGTVAGDRAEIETLKRIFETADLKQPSCAIGSVKSMIGHTKCAAGAAGLIKVAMALYHKVLPPTIGIEEPNASLQRTPFYLNTEPRPWVQGITEDPRRAGVSAFGFGGTNFHAVVEEYTDTFMGSPAEAVSHQWPSELLLWAGRSRQELLGAIDSLEQALAQDARPALRDLAYTLWHHAKDRPGPKLAVVATSLDDLRQKLTWVRENLRKSGDIQDPRGIYLSEKPLGREGKVAFLFSGQGSQYPDMLKDLVIQFPEVRGGFELADRVLADRFPRPLSTYVFPPHPFSQEEERDSQQALTQTNVAQAALGAAEMGIFRLLRTLGIEPDMAAGHSYGEYVALCAAGVFSEEMLYALSEARGRFILEAAGQDLGTMAAVEAGRERIVEVLQSVEGVWVANLNAPNQTIISGTQAGVEEAMKRLETQGIRVRPIPVSCAFHSPVTRPARDRLAEFISTISFAAPRMEVFSNTTAGPYPVEPNAIAALLSEHLIRPVDFVSEIETMYRSAARIFVEVGPRNVLTNLTQQILYEQPHLAVSLDASGRSSLIQVHHALGQLAAHGVQIQLDRLYGGRSVHQLNLETLAEETGRPTLSPTTWLVDGGRARPLQETPKPKPSVASADAARTADAFPMRPSSESGIQSPDALAQARPHATPMGSTSPPTNGEVDRVMLQFQQLMDQFLETQRQVMLAYLRGAPLPPEASDLLKTLGRGPLPMGKPSVIRPRRGIINWIRKILRSQPEGRTDESAHLQPTEPIAIQKPQKAIDKEQLTSHLLQIVSDRTGYPPEMLHLDLDLEADLSIDSIKWVEILGTLQQSYLQLDQQQAQAAMGELIKAKTLRDIVDWIDNALQSQPERQKGETGPAKAAEPISIRESKPAIDEDGAVEIPRFLMRAVDAPVEGHPLQIASGSIFLITDDERGIAQVMADELRRLGGRVALIRMGDNVEKTGRDLYAADLTDPVSVAELLKLIRRRRGSIAGIIHLLPLKAEEPFGQMSFKDWQSRVRLEVKSIFHLAKAANKDFKQATEKRWVIAATAMGGAFASDREIPESLFPGHGGIAGLIKTLALDWSTVQCRVVDLDPRAEASSLASYLLREMASGEGGVEVGYRGSLRLVLRAEPASLTKESPVSLHMDSDWVVLVTGGARGITAEVAIELARRYHPTILVVGRSPLPEGEESPETISLTSPKDLKAALINHMRQRGQEVTPAQVEAAYKQLRRDREIRGNLAAIREAGATVQYYQVDVRDEQAFGNLIEEIYGAYGRLDGVIHGAGVIEDKLLEDKAPDSFDRVFDTKADSAFILSRKLRADSLRFLVFFSSVAGRFGNRGQSDYAAANEVLNKLAIYLDRQWPGRIMSINWCPWAKTGMASAEVERQFAERGVQLIPSSAGPRILDEELAYGLKGQVEVVIGDGPWRIVDGTRSSSPGVVLPLLADVPLTSRGGGSIEVTWTLDPTRHRYLQDHQLDGKPVFPLAFAMELMAEVVQMGWSELEVVGIRSLRRFRGITLDSDPREIRIVASPQNDSPSEDGILEVDVEIAEPDGRDHPCYRATVQIGQRPPAPSSYDHIVLSDLRPFPMTVDEAYRRWLFQGPCLQGISKIEGINEKGICGVLLPSSPVRCLHQNADGQWLIDPVLLDSAFQLAILWERAHYDMTPLPSHVTSYRRFDSPSGLPVRCWTQAQSSAGGHILLTNFYFMDAQGRLISLIEEMEHSCSTELNRLAGLSASG